MSSTTTRVSLYKPAGGENVNVTTDLNNNLDKIDTNLNFRVVANATARNAISPFWAGLNVRETDTGKLYVSNGSAPISASWQEIVQTNVRTTDELLIGNLVRAQRTNATDSMFESKAAADANARWFSRADGQMWWGPGTATQDTNLYRSAQDTLKTDDSFVAGVNLQSLGNKVIFGSSAAKSTVLSTSTTVANTITETIVATLTIPANDMVAGSVYKITAFGTASVTGTPSINFRGRFGGIGGTQFAQTSGIGASSGVTNKCWNVEIYVVCLTSGASGSIFGRMTTVENISVAGTNPTSIPVTRIDGSGTSTQNTTIANDLVLTVAWGTASASNTLTCRGYTCERVA